MCPNRVGFSQKKGDATQYLVLPESFKSELVRGYSPKRAASVLRKAGWLEFEGKHTTIKKKVPDLGWTWVYALTLPNEISDANTNSF